MDLLIIEPVPPGARRSLASPGLWAGLVTATRARVMRLAPVWAFGDLTAAMRCADLPAVAVAAPEMAGHG